VGCTSIIERYTNNYFGPDLYPIGVEFRMRHLDNLDEKRCSIQMWDRYRSNERFLSTPPFYYRNASALFLVFDITNRKSFQYLDRLIESIPNTDCYPYEIYIVGNKCDLIEQRVISKEEANEYSTKHAAIYFEVSAKDNINVLKKFDEIAITHFFNKLNDPPPKPIQQQQTTNTSQSSYWCNII